MFLDDLLIQFPPPVKNGSFSGLKMWDKMEFQVSIVLQKIYKSLS